jgi:hypothetical protein
MKNYCIVTLLLLYFIPCLTFSQTDKGTLILESGKTILDIIKNAKKDKAIVTEVKTTSSSDQSGICIVNPTDKRISVELLTSGTIKNNVCKATVPQNDSICCYNLVKGIYHLKIIEANTNPEIVIKENEIEIVENKKISIVVR